MKKQILLTLSSLFAISVLFGCASNEKESSSNSNSLSNSVNSNESINSISSDKNTSISINDSTSHSSSNKNTSSSTDINRCNHDNEISYVTPNTCSIDGYTTHICLTCGNFYKDNIVKKTSNHNYSYEYAYYNYVGMWNPSKQYYSAKMCLGCGAIKDKKSITLSKHKTAIDNKDNICSNHVAGVIYEENGTLVALPMIGYKFLKWDNEETNNKITSYSDNSVAIFTQTKRDLPILNINLKNNVTLKDVDRAAYKDATYTFIDSSNNIETLEGYFKGRGNGSWVEDTGKSGYNIKLLSKAKPFSMTSKSKKWIIVPSANDYSMHINYSAYNLVRSVFKNIEWQVETKFIEVYINNEYRGVYLFADKISEENDRLPIKTEDANGEYDLNHTNPGFLIEYDRYATKDGQEQSNYYLDHEPLENYTYFKVNKLYRPFSIKYPDPEDLHMYGGPLDDSLFNKVILSIKSQIENFANVLETKSYKDLIDVVDISSFIDMYLIHELFKNSDVGWSSFYIYKKPNETKLRFGPAWDFDLASIYARDNSTSGKHISIRTLSGNIYKNETANYNDMFVKASKFNEYSLALNNRFKDVAKDLYPSITNLLGGKDNASLGLMYNQIRWHNDSKETYGATLDKVYSWLLERSKWMLNNNFVD